jgi:hypothetical protein
LLLPFFVSIPFFLLLFSLISSFIFLIYFMFLFPLFLYMFRPCYSIYFLFYFFQSSFILTFLSFFRYTHSCEGCQFHHCSYLHSLLIHSFFYCKILLSFMFS